MLDYSPDMEKFWLLDGVENNSRHALVPSLLESLQTPVLSDVPLVPIHSLDTLPLTQVLLTRSHRKPVYDEFIIP